MCGDGSVHNFIWGKWKVVVAQNWIALGCWNGDHRPLSPFDCLFLRISSSCFQIWWRKDGELLPRQSARLRQMAPTGAQSRRGRYSLRIRYQLKYIYVDDIYMFKTSFILINSEMFASPISESTSAAPTSPAGSRSGRRYTSRVSERILADSFALPLIDKALFKLPFLPIMTGIVHFNSRKLRDSKSN